MKVSRSVCLVTLTLAAILFQTDKFIAHAATVPPGACLYALDPTADRAFQIAGAQSVYTACGVVSESSASDGFEMEGSETLYLQNHAQVSVVGGAQLNGQTYLLDTISNQQVQVVKTASPGDPLLSITAPTTGTIVSKSPAYFDMNSKPANNTLSPGVYCGGLTIGNTNGTAFTMSPGTYIMAGGGLVLNSQAVVNGSGVTVYNTSSAGWGCSSSYNYTPITISGQVTATLSAPTTGALNGILFFGNRAGCSTAGSCVDQINGGSTAVLNGTLYFKSDEIEITGSNASGYMMLVADKIYINGNSTFGNNGNPFDGITVSASPSTTTLFSGQTQQFTATVNNSANPAVTWTINPTGVGSISSTGLYTAPSSVTALQTVTITATSQADTSKSATATVTLEVTKSTPAITWANPGAITYGTALSSTQLDATASVAGTFVYTPAAGTVLAAGSQTLSVTFTPTNATSYNTATATITLTVNKATPTIAWATPAAITYGTPLSATQLAATTSVAGTFAYTPPAGTVLAVGSQTLSVTFTPTNTANYNTATAVVPLIVNQASQTISFTAASSMTYGVTPISLSATASSGLSVTFSMVSGPGSITGSTLTITGTGTVVVAANQAGNASYAAAAQVTQSIVVTQAVLTVTAGNASRAYGAANPSFTDTVTGFVNGDTSSVVSGSPTLTTTATSTSAVGTYPITATAGTLSAANYSFTFAAGTLTITQASTGIVCSPVAITYGTPLSLTQLNCTSGGVTGNFVLTPAVGTVLPAGVQSISVAFTPTDTTDYKTATASVSLTVTQATPVIKWATPAAITYGTALNATQLNASSTVAGTLTYSPAAGTVLTAGAHTLSVTFAPTDTTDYTTATASVPVTVSQATPVITWPTPAAITYGTALSSTQLNASPTVAGTFTYSPAAGAVLTAGTQSLNVTFTPTDTADYTTATATVTLTVNQATPVITWATPAAITYGTALSTAQLDATSSAAGTFAYTPASGTIPAAGTQTLTATFMPTDATDFSTATTFATLTVNQATPVITWATPTAVSSGTALSAAQLDATANVPGTFVYAPALGTIPAAGTQTLSVTFTPTDTTDYSTATATVALTVNNLRVSVTVTPSSGTLYAGQTQQFTATVASTSNTTVFWTINPEGVGATISQAGVFTAPATISAQQTVTITATSQADTTQSASATVTLVAAQCGSNGYSYQRAIVIDHTKVPNTDQTSFPFLFNTTDPFLATITNNGHVANPNGYDIIFTSDPAGQNVLNYEMEEYNPINGQVVAWIRIPTLSHTTDTVIYVFYGNPSITTSQQNPTAVWGTNFTSVWHLPNGTNLSANDSTASANNGILEGGISATPGIIDGAAVLNGSRGYVATSNAINGPSVYSLSLWFNTSTTNGGKLIGFGSNRTGSSGNYDRQIYMTNSGQIVFGNWNSGAATVTSPASYNDGHWHSVVGTLEAGEEVLYIDGVLIGSNANSTPQTYSGYWRLGYDNLNSWPNQPNSYFFGGSLDEARVSAGALSADWISTEYNNQSSPATFYALYPENGVGVIPAAVNLYAAQSQQFTAAGACGTAVNWSIPSNSQGMLTAGGLYAAPASIATQQTVAITATSQGSGEYTGTAVVTLLPPPMSPTLTLTAAAQPPYVTGTSQNFTATVKNGSGTPISGVVVTFTVSGANSKTGSGTTGSNGVVSYTYTGANSGIDSIQATTSVSGVQVTSNSISAVWIVPVQPISTSTVYGEFFPTNDACSFDASAATTPVFTQIFPTINFNPPSGTIPGNTSSINVNSRPFTDVTTNLNGNYTGTIVAEGNGYQAGVGPMYYFEAVFTGEFTVANAGNTVFNFFDDDGFIFGIGDGATRVSGASSNMPPATLVQQYPAMGADNNVTEGGPIGNQVVVNFPAAGTYRYEVDYTECDGGQLALTMTQGASSPTGVAPTGSLTLSPNSINPLPFGGSQTFTVFAGDAAGNPVPNLPIGLVVTGVDQLQLSGTTNSSGYATIVYKDVNPGTTYVQAVAFVSGMVTYSNQVTVPWALPPTTTTGSGGSGTLSIGISAENTVTLPNTLQLNGTVNDSPGLTPSIAWSEVSGSGTVTFSAPQQAATIATFSQAGNYVLQLSASDASGNSGSVPWQVTVNPVPGTTQGWIGSPLNGAAVSGLVPITVAAGKTLASGTLTYYPSTNPNDVTVLNSDTTGSGKIGVLDTTTMNNGSYWITLQATDTSGDTSYNLALVTVTGNYKPGRVTATVTDLVVPATGLAINIQRTYDSLNAGTSSDFGYGWSLGINTNLTVDPKGDVTFTLGGQRRTFYLTPQSGGWLFPWYFVAFTPEPGLHGTLTDSGSGCADLLDFVVPDGSIWYCIGGGQYNPPGYIYTDPTGTSYTISAAGNLQSIQDRSGNGLTITANGITSTTGLSVPFVRDSSNRITQITDPQGNIYSYGYDSNGNLATVTYPNTTTPSTYTYDANHLYLSGTDARSYPLPVTTYFGATDTDPNGNSLNGRLQSVSDALGETTSYTYNIATNTTAVTYPHDANGNAGTATMVYDNYGMLLSSTDPLGNVITNLYDAKHNLISTTDPLGHKTIATYDNNGNKTSSTYPATATSKNTTSYTVYNQYSEPTQTTDELGNVRVFNYDANYNPQSVTDSAGALASFVFNPNQTLQAGAIGFDISAQPGMASQFSYDANGNMASRTDALGRTTTYTYNSLGQKTAMVTPTPTTPAGGSSSTTLYQYDALGNLTQTAAPLGRTTGSTYDANGNKISSTDARGNVTNYLYDPLNRLIETDYPSNSTTPATKSTRTYDFRNNVIRATDQNGNVTLNAYDLAGRLISATRGYGTSSASTTTYGYDNAGRKISETDALGHTTSYTYDAAGRLAALSGVKGNFTYLYDDAGNRISQTDGNNNTTQFQYDARKRLVKTLNPDATTIVNSYDGPGNLASVTDQASNVVQYTYDAANQLKTVVQLSHPNPSSNTNFYGYDNLGNLSGLTDQNLHTTQNWFDLFNEPVQKTLPDGTLTETRSYDQAGNLVSLTHFNGVTTTYTYDALNRLLTRATPGEATVSFTYTATGKYSTSTAGDGTVNYAYDGLDHLITKATPEGTLSYTYYASGNVESIVSSNPNGVSVTLTWDDLNRLSTVIDNRLPSGANTAVYTYDPAGNVATATYPNGFQTTFTYDQLSRMTGLSTPVSSYSYQLGATGNRVNATEGNGRALTWNYDGIYRLTNEQITNDPSKNDGSVSYGLDPVGNRLSAISTLPGINPIAGTYNADDEISSETYDANGNVIATEGITYAYDSQNHMTSETGNGKVITMVYDAFGNRVSKTVNGVTTKYLVEDDVNPTGLPQVLEEVQNGAAVRTYTYGLQRISESQFIGNVWTTSFYGYDGAGSVRQLTNSAGVVTDEYEYDAYGNSFTKSGTTPNNYLYRGEQYDSDLGLYYLRARYYNPNTGRFLSRDPLEGDPADPQSLHKYLYAGGDPVNRIDPSGRADSIETIFTITVIATPTEVALSALAGQATAAIALLQMAAGQAYLTAQYAFELIAAAGEATGISKLLVCGAVGLVVAQVEAEHKITNPEKTAIGLAFSYACARIVPLPGPPPIKW